MKKRGQAAMEFLMTYGWALVIVVIVIVALVAFGVLRPSKLLPETCNLGPGFGCQQFKIDGINKRIHIQITNGFGKSLDEFGVAIKKETDPSSELCGGFVGFISLSGDANFPAFSDGETKFIGHRFPIGVGQGINCKNQKNCCASDRMRDLTVPRGYDLCPNVPTFDPDTGTSLCNELNSTLISKRFSEDILVFYRVAGSSIVHLREGVLAGVVE